jgi:hypothetical protein
MLQKNRTGETAIEPSSCERDHVVKKSRYKKQRTDRGISRLSKFRTFMISSLNCAGKQAEVIQNYVNPNVRNIGQGEAQHRKYKRLKLGGGQAYDR